MFSHRALAISALLFVSLGYLLMSVASRFMAIGFDSMTQVYLRVFGAALVTSAIFHKTIRWHKFRTLAPRDWLALAIMGIFGYGFMVYAIVRGALQTTLLNVSILFSIVPLFVYLLGVLLFRRRPSLNVILILAISIWGVGVLVSGSLIPSLTGFGAGDWWVVLAAFLEAVWFVGIRYIGQKLNSRELTIAAQLFAGITCLTVATLLGESIPALADFANWQVLAGLLFGIAQNIWAPLLTVYAFQYLDEVFATQLFLTENIWALLIGVLFYAEYPSPVALIGAGIVIASVYFMNKIQAKVD